MFKPLKSKENVYVFLGWTSARRFASTVQQSDESREQRRQTTFGRHRNIRRQIDARRFADWTLEVSFGKTQFP